MRKYYETTLERVRDYYGLIMDLDRLKKMINTLKQVSTAEIKKVPDERLSEFLEKYKLIDTRALENNKSIS
jgi:ureidoacrylate peracid hydrolase